MNSIMMGVVMAFVGVLPLLLGGKLKTCVGMFFTYAIVAGSLDYLATLSTVGPLFGSIGLVTLLLVIISTVIMWLLVYEDDSRSNPGSIVSSIGAVVLVITFFGVGVSGCGAFRSHDYAALIGEVDNREWTQDIQPKDPKHVRLVPYEMAIWLANKQLGEAGGSIGSQFQIGKMTLQKVNDELLYVAPLDYKGFRAWTNAPAAPGYVVVHAEDPRQQPTVVADKKLVYTPAAYFGKDLNRHLWSHGYRDKGLTEYSLELDEDGKAWWVVKVYHPTIAYSGDVIDGVAIVDPETGAITFYAVDEVPEWVDRVMPENFVRTYLKYAGAYVEGWINSFWGHHNVTEPEEPNLIYGSDGQAYWVTGQTSNNLQDQSLLGVYYTNSRTGKTTRYHATGGTDEAVVQAVNNVIGYKRWHGSGPMLYNIYGVMTSVVPLLGENHSYQGVAFVRIDNLAVAIGDDQTAAAREYQKVMNQSGQQLALAKGHDVVKATGKVIRVGNEVEGGETIYFLYLTDTNFLLTGGSEQWHTLPLTQPGDDVRFSFVDSGEDVVPLVNFENLSLSLRQTDDQSSLDERVHTRQQEEAGRDASKSLRGTVENMTDEELEALLKQRGK